ncbi:unnamed protein product [Merluccius merluccius]
MRLCKTGSALRATGSGSTGPGSTGSGATGPDNTAPATLAPPGSTGSGATGPDNTGPATLAPPAAMRPLHPDSCGQRDPLDHIRSISLPLWSHKSCSQSHQP